MSLLKKSSFYRYCPAAVVRVTGGDAASYLQGQFTNDLRSLGQGTAVYGLWLNQKGKVLADSFIFKGAAEDEFFLMSYFSNSVSLLARLEAYVIADEVGLEDVTAEWQGVSVATSAFGDVRPCFPPTSFSFPGRRARSENLEILFLKIAGEEVQRALLAAGMLAMTSPEMEYLRIIDGIPSIPRDIGPGELPNEGGLEKTAISYAKGCYLGQEVMARLKSMGQVRRHLLPVAGEEMDLPPLPAPLFLEERKVGELRSGIAHGTKGFVGLALVSLLHVTSETLLSFGPAETPRVRIVSATPPA